MQLKERGREKLYPSTVVVTNPNGGRQSMVKVDRSFSVVVKLNGELGNSFAVKTPGMNRKMRATQSAAHRW